VADRTNMTRAARRQLVDLSPRAAPVVCVDLTTVVMGPLATRMLAA